MKKVLKKSFALLLAVLCTMNFVVVSFAQESSGECGEKVLWSYDESNGALTISGAGKMYDYNAAWSPFWTYFSDSIKKVVVDEGVTSIGDQAFSGIQLYTVSKEYSWKCKNLKEVQLSDSVESIGIGAFAYAEALEKINVPVKTTKISEYAFYGCKSLKEINYAGTLVQWNKIEKDYGNEVLAKATVYCKGDINRDGKTNSTDALMVLQHSVKKIELTSWQIILADVYADSKINSSDALEILKISVGSTK